MPDSGRGEPIGQGTPGILGRSIGFHDERAELGMLRTGVELYLVNGEELSGDEGRGVVLVKFDEEGCVGVATHVVQEHGFPTTDVELREDDVAHGHGQCPVGARGDAQPLVGEFRVVGVVGAHDDDLLAVIARLGHEVGVGCAGHRYVGPPHDEVLGVEPVAGLRHVGLVPEHLGTGWGQVGIPVVEAQHGATEQFGEPGAGTVGHHGHGWDDGEPGDAVGPVGLDGVHIGRRNDLRGFLPCHTYHTAMAAGTLVGPGTLRVVDDGGPGVNRIAEFSQFLAPEVEQDRTHVGMTDAGGRVLVPAECCSTRTTTWFIVGHVGAGGRVVGLLGLPGDDAVLDVDLPRTRPGAVHSVGGANHLVVGPTLPVEGVGLAPAFQEQLACVGRRHSATQPGPHPQQC